MAKRGAGTELNHDNWDQEEESEEAGEFKKATEDQMKGRVIRKAKRRNLNEDQRKNVFSGFGGFTSSNIDAKDAFSFLSKPAEGNESKAEGFAVGNAGVKSDGLFGSLSAAKKPQESSGFIFGVSNNGGGADAGNTAFSGFSFGNATKDKEDESKDTNAGKGVDKVEGKNEEESKSEAVDMESEPADDLFAKFKSKSAGTWSCDVCMISNDATKDKCAACETPKPGTKKETDKANAQSTFSFGTGGGFKFGASTNSAPEPTSKPSTEAPPAPADDLFAKFKTKSAGNWSCDVCMISNDATKDKCAACETPKPGTKKETDKATVQPTFSFGTGGGFKFGAEPSPTAPEPTSKPSAEAPPADDLFAKFKSKSAGTWACDVCMISNDATKDACAACETPKPGTKKEAASTDSQPTFSFGEGGGFKFGAAPATNTSNSTLAGFKFGSDTTGVSNDGGGGFNVGTSEPSKPAEQCAGFKFGSSDKTSKPTEQVSGFTFGTSNGSSSSEAVATGFKFGTGSPTGTGAKNDIFKSAEGGFKFSSNEKVASKVKVESCDTPQTKSKKSEYLADLKALNIQVTNWIKSHVDGNPLVDLTPVFKDYEKHLDEMRKKFNIQTSLRPTDKVKLNLDKETNGSDKCEKVEAKKEKNTATGENVDEEPKPFSFGLNQPGFGTGFGTSNSSFQFGFLKKDEKVEETKSDEDEAVASEPVVEAIVENDAFYTKKCKLFYKKAGAYVERGLGNIYLKKTDESKLQVIVRADTALGNILLNIIMTEDIPVDRVGKNNVMLICIPNPPVDPKADPEPVTFLIRVKTTEDADELKDKLGELVKSEN